jgi:hypothetical protein
MNTARKLKFLKWYLWIICVGLFFWWPLSHWFYSDLYHRLLGFDPGAYPDGMVKIIGTCGIIPVMLAAFAALDPVKNRAMITTLIVFSFALAFTYIFLISDGNFPVQEYINVGISLFSGTLLLLLLPERYKDLHSLK